jgi:adenylate cyclase
MDVDARVARALRPLPVIWRVRTALGILLVSTNAIGAVVVFCLIALVVPLPHVEDETRLEIENLVLTAIYAAAAIAVGMVRGLTLNRDIVGWLRQGREASAADQEAVLGAPVRLFWMQVQLWALGALLFGIFNLRVDVGLGFLVAGIVSLAWLFGTGVAVLGIVFAAIQSLALGDQVSKLTLQLTMLVLASTALLVGALTTWLAARASSDPVRSLRRAVAEVGRGRLDTHVDIYDGTELGILQAGFNDMVHGLRERETIRDLFGRHVGTDVARAALEGGVRLGGEVRDVAVLFVDIIGSTTLATERPPEEVVSLLNQFFDVVIDVVHEHDGWINKFEGDAALAIWGAPIEVPARDQRILTAARVLGERLAAEVPEIAAGVGVSGGRVVAGNVGASERYEYTVIGDPVNEAARLTGHAKSVPARVVANARLLEGAGDEAAHWEPLEPIVVRGRSEPTAVMTPRDAP